VGIWPNRRVLGGGAREMLPKVLAGLGASRALVVCGKTVAAGRLLKRVLAVLGANCAGVFNEVSAHTPLPMVERALAAMRAAGADAILSVGGGSAIDAGKGLALLGMATGPLDSYRVRYGSEGELAQQGLPRSGVPHIAIPTTSGSASEVMPTSAIRDIVQLKKLLFWDDALIPQAVIL